MSNETNLTTRAIDAIAKRLYETYCEAAGGKAFNGDPLPGWDEFASDPKKDKQANAWREAAKAAYPKDMSYVSDGYHTFGELYDHRFALFCLLSALMPMFAWRSKKHHDGTMFEGGYFVCGLNFPSGSITYHYKLERWDKLNHVQTLDLAPKWDGHDSKDVIQRIHRYADMVSRSSFDQPDSPANVLSSDPVRQNKALRAFLDNLLQVLKESTRKSRSRACSITKIEEAIMWLGKDLQELGTPNPYPESKNPDSPVIHPSADGLKL